MDCRHTFERDQSGTWGCARCGLSLAAYQARAVPETKGLTVVEHTYTERGFADYGELEDEHGCTVRVRQSSSVDPHCWLFVESPSNLNDRDSQRVSTDLHLQPSEVARLIAALTSYLQHYAELWSEEAE